MIMKTTIKFVSRDSYLDKVLNKVIYTNKVKIGVSNEVDAILRDEDNDGVVSFVKGLSKTFKMKSSAFSAQIRNNVPDSWSGMLSYFLDSNKLLTEDEYFLQLNVALNGATINLEAKLQEADDDSEDAKEVFFYTISDIELTSIAKLVIGSKFCRECLFMTDMNDIKSFISTLE